ncbi:MAG: hypothetical protein KCHDKBKB_02800 [Elusimicrobia bacterium]|nr:hypothetical protein [Elusimicrobiota bacterium]
MLEHLKNTNDDFCMPQIVFDEIANKFRETLTENQEKISSKIHQLHQLIDIDLPLPLSSEKIQVESEKYKKWLEDHLRDNDAEILPYPQNQHKEMVDRALRRKRPYKPNGAGYRDDLIWLTVVSDLIARKTKTAFVSNNIRDYANENGQALHPDLETDLTSKDISPSDVVFYPSLDALVEQYIRPRLKNLKTLAMQINSGQFASFNLMSWLEENLDEVLKEHECSGFDSEFDEVTFECIDSITSAEVTSVDEMSEDEVILDIIVRFKGTVHFFILASDYWSMSDDESDEISVYDPDWNEKVMWAGRSTDMEARISITIDLKSGDITSTDVSELSRHSPNS